MREFLRFEDAYCDVELRRRVRAMVAGLLRGSYPFVREGVEEFEQVAWIRVWEEWDRVVGAVDVAGLAVVYARYAVQHHVRSMFAHRVRTGVGEGRRLVPRAGQLSGITERVCECRVARRLTAYEWAVLREELELVDWDVVGLLGREGLRCLRIAERKVNAAPSLLQRVVGEDWGVRLQEAVGV